MLLTDSSAEKYVLNFIIDFLFIVPDDSDSRPDLCPKVVGNEANNKTTGGIVAFCLYQESQKNL